MQKEYLILGKEIIKEISKTWGNLGYLNEDFIDDIVLEEIGNFVFNDKEIYNDYVYYRNELVNFYNERDIKFEGHWMSEWWCDNRGAEYQKDTFNSLANIVIEAITGEVSGWYYDEENDYYLPSGCVYNSTKDIVVLACNENSTVNLKYAQCS